MSIPGWLSRLFRWAGHSPAHRMASSGYLPARVLDIRIPGVLFERVRAHVEDFRLGEEAGFLICSLSRLQDRDALLAREWIPVPAWAIERDSHGSVLSWSAKFNSEVLERAVELGATAILVHSHGRRNPTFSPDDRAKERALFGAFSRILAPLPTGTLLLGKGDVVGSFWSNGSNDVTLERLVVLGDTIEIWRSAPPELRPELPARQRLSRQSIAIGPESDLQLAAAKVAIVGVSGGGSHVVQQLSHQGVGNLIVVDDETVDESNLGRLVGATAADIDKTLKVDLAERVANGIDPSIAVEKISNRFPSRETILGLKEADIIVACLDTFRGREAINAFCRRYLIPLLDIGMSIRTTGERLATADGQLIATIPGRPCLRCWFITDAVLERERRDRPPGYDRNPDAPGEPQVVSMNGVLASEACNCVLDLITGYSHGRRGAKVWQYEGRSGELQPAPVPSHRDHCPACAEEGHGDPSASSVAPSPPGKGS